MKKPFLPLWLPALLLLAAYFLSGPYLVPGVELDHNPALRLWKLRLFFLVVPAFLLAAWVFGRRGSGAVPGLAERIDRFGFGRLTALAALLGLAVYATHATVLFQRIPHVWDTAGYLFQARIMAGGHLSAAAPPSPDHFWLYPMIVWQGTWFALYPVGHSALLALGVLAGAPWLVGPCLGAANLVLVSCFLREALTRRRLAAAGTLLFLCSPFVLFMSSSFQGHNSNLLGTAVFLLFYARGRSRSGRLNPLLAGAGLGFSFLTRPLSALALALPFVIFEFADLFKSRQAARHRNQQAGGTRSAAIRRNILITAGFLPFAAAFLFQNAAQTGSPFRTGYSIGFPAQQVGLSTDGSQQLGRHGEDFSHTPLNALLNLRSRIMLLSTDLYGWPFLCLVPALIAMLAALRRRLGRKAGNSDPPAGGSDPRVEIASRHGIPWIGLSAGVMASFFAAYALFWNPGYGFGARYYYATMPLLLLLTLEGLTVLAGVGGRITDTTAGPGTLNRLGGTVADQRHRRTRLVLFAVAALVLVNCFFYLPLRYRQFLYTPHYANVDNRLAGMVEAAGLEESLIFVESHFMGYYNYSSALPLNRPDLTGNVFARELGEPADAGLREAFPLKTPYTFRFVERTGRLVLSEFESGRVVLEEPAPAGRTRYPPGFDPGSQRRYWEIRKQRIGAATVRRPNVLLVVVDTLRRDRLSCYGHTQQTSPHIDRLAAEGAQFTSVYSTAPWTLPAHGSLFTGLLPTEHGSHWEHHPLDGAAPTLAERLRDAGYRTAGRSANPWLSRKNMYHRGFDEYEVAIAWGKTVRETGDKGAGEAVRWALERVDTWERMDDGSPFFVFLNLMEPHLPYIPPEEYAAVFAPPAPPGLEETYGESTLHHLHLTGQVELARDDFRILSGRYDGLVSYTDFRIGRLAAGLRTRGLLDETLIILVSDHGENLGDHGLMDHQFCIFDTLLSIPLIIRFPAAVPAGARPAAPALISDVPSFIIETCGLTGGETVAGNPLCNTADGDGTDNAGRDDNAASRILPAEYHLPLSPLARLLKLDPDFPTGKYRHRLFSLREGNWKLIHSPTGRTTLHNLDNDPGEMTDLSAARPEITRRLLDELFVQYPHLDRVRAD